MRRNNAQVTEKTPETVDGASGAASPEPKKEASAVPPEKKKEAAAASTEGSAEEPKPRKRRRGRGRTGGGQRQRTPKRGGDRGGGKHHATTAIRALSQMAQGLLEVEGIDFLSRPRFMDIEVRVPLDAGRDGSKAAGQVIERILQRVKEVRDHDRALAPGAVYSYYTETADGEMCRPKDEREVFDGYSSTGRPKFTDFVTMAIERKQEGIDELLAGEDVVLTHVAMGRVLRTAQLAEFGKTSPVYRILGQVDAGVFSLINSANKAAFSFQLLRGKTLEGRPRLRVHPVGAADVLDLADPSLPAILSRFQQRLDQEALRLAGALSNAGDGEEVDEEEFVLPLLQDLAKQISGRARRKSRRTKHADERSQQGQRPTAKAFEDAKAAADDQILWDDRENTAVVLGPRGRVHVFTSSAKHVTSLMMQGSAIGRRRQQRQWRPAEPEERGEFRIALRRIAATPAVEEAVVAASSQPAEKPPVTAAAEEAPGPEPESSVPTEPAVADSVPDRDQSDDGDKVDQGS